MLPDHDDARHGPGGPGPTGGTARRPARPRLFSRPSAPDARRPPVAGTLVIGTMLVSLSLRSVRQLDNKPVRLTGQEFDLLAALIAAQGRVVTRADLCASVLNRAWRPGDRAIDQMVFCLRRKLPHAEDGSSLVQSIRNKGYWLRQAEEAGR